MLSFSIAHQDNLANKYLKVHKVHYFHESYLVLQWNFEFKNINIPEDEESYLHLRMNPLPH